MKKKLLSVALGATLLGSAVAEAQTSARGVYLYGGIGAVSNSADHQEANRVTAVGGAGQATSFSRSSDTALRLGLGYRYNQTWAAEVSYARLGKLSHTATNIGLNTTVTDVKPHAWQVAALGFMPLGGAEVFGKLGLAFTGSDVSVSHSALFFGCGVICAPAKKKSDVAPVIGLGLNYAVAGRWMLRAELEHVTKYAYASVDDLRPVFGPLAQPGGNLHTRTTSLALSVGYKF